MMAGLAPTTLKIPKKGQIGYQDREQRVDRIAAGIVSQDNPLMRRAAAAGLQVANRRGLLNSSLAAQSSQNAVLDVAVPMASQNAAQAAAQNLSAQGYNQDRAATDQQYQNARGLQSQQYNHQKGLAAQGEGIDGRLMDRQFTGQGKLSAQESQQRLSEMGRDYGYRSDLSEQEYGQTRGLARDAFGYETKARDQAGRLQRDQTKLQGNIDTAAQRRALGAADRSTADSTVNTVFNQYQSQIQSIMANPNLSASERAAALQSAKGLAEKRINMTSRIFDKAFDWPKGLFGAA